MDTDGGPRLVRWWFDEEVQDETDDLVDISCEFDDGSLRWAWIGTPDYLKRLLEQRDDPEKWDSQTEPAVWATNLIVIRRLAAPEVDWVLNHIDARGELLAVTRPYDA